MKISRGLCNAMFGMLLLLSAGSSWAERRVALVIGNSAYTEAPLRNPLNDAQDMSQVLEAHDFDVTRLQDVDQRSMEQAIRLFNRKLDKDTVGLFYFAGHGLQVSGENYLIPVDSQIESEVDVRYEAVSLGRVLDGMGRSGGGLNLVILDACRNNPYTRSFRSSERGFARAAPTTAGTMIMYATEPGKVAADGEGRNGVFTGELLRLLEAQPQLEVEQLFKGASSGVYRKTSGRQSPWTEGVIRGRFSFARVPEPTAESAASASDKPSADEQLQLAELPQGSLDKALWDVAQQDNTESGYRLYLEQFPEGVFAGFATKRLTALQRAREQRELERSQAEAERLAEQERALREQAEAELQQALQEQQQREAAEQAQQREAQLAKAKTAEAALSLTRNWRRGVQVGLNEAGFDVGMADGLWGARTRAGIGQWQASRGLPETGYLNETDYRQLVAELSVQEVVPPKPKRQVVEPEMVRIAGGTFEMGTRGGRVDERPVRNVRVSAFEMGKYEVTFDQYDEYARSVGVALPDDEGWGRGNRPVINVSWKDAQGYIAWLNANSSGGYRLPSEAQWEYATRASTTGAWSFRGSENELCDYANQSENYNHQCKDGFEQTAPVGSFKANGNGLFDVHGNVWEWVEDCWHGDYEGAPVNGSAWVQGGDCSRRVLRGGSWKLKPVNLRSANRGRDSTSFRSDYSGFRVSRTLTPMSPLPLYLFNNTCKELGCTAILSPRSLEYGGRLNTHED